MNTPNRIKNPPGTMRLIMAYNFFDLGAWLLDPEKGGASDEIENEHGLGAYDGLEPEA